MAAREYLSRRERRAMAAHSRVRARARPERLTEIPRAEWPPLGQETVPRIAVFHSRRYLVQVFDEGHSTLYGAGGPREWIEEVTRLTVCRVTLNADGHWDEALTWDELQAIKHELGFGDQYAIEIYPRDVDAVNVANMRHLWILSRPLPIGWFK